MLVVLVLVTAIAEAEFWLNELSLFFQDQSPSRPTTQLPNCRREPTNGLMRYLRAQNLLTRPKLVSPTLSVLIVRELGNCCLSQARLISSSSVTFDFR
jgi:hypothetical protein